MRKAICYIAIIFMTHAVLYAQTSSLNIIPKPQSCIFYKGSVTIPAKACYWTNLHKDVLKNIIEVMPTKMKRCKHKSDAFFCCRMYRLIQNSCE
jgi:hypothetical protein